MLLQFRTDIRSLIWMRQSNWAWTFAFRTVLTA
jgi:hypothetical protein